MERVNRNKTHNGRGKGKTVQEQASSDAPLTRHTREPNWNNEETQRLLNAIEDAQLHYVKKDLKFTTQEWNHICELHNAKEGRFRSSESIKNRIKTLKAEYINWRELANRSGWGWDYEKTCPYSSTSRCVESSDKGMYLIYFLFLFFF
jgi:Myb/SANT-like DNA-binding domain